VGLRDGLGGSKGRSEHCAREAPGKESIKMGLLRMKSVKE
jgi:hypothetical protein